MSHIDSIAGLEAILGKTPPAVNLKVIDHVDESAMRWLAAALLIPGSAQVAILRGTAMLTDDDTARASFEVQGKVPLLATRVDDVEVDLRASPALARAALWPAAAAPADIKPAKMFADHVKLNKDKGLGARIAGAFVSVPGLMQRGLDKDYKDNLY
jgi:hypothetical protein